MAFGPDIGQRNLPGKFTAGPPASGTQIPFLQKVYGFHWL